MISLIALPEGRAPGAQELARDLTELLGKDFQVAIEADTGTVTLATAGESIRLLSRNEPIPWKLIEPPARAAWYWPEAADTLQRHAGYVTLVTPSGRAKPLLRCMLLTRVSAAVGERYGYLGVYWDSATLVHEADEFSASAKAMSPGQLPLRLWINFRVIQEPDETHSLSTLGLEALGAREIEVWGSHAAPQTMMQWAYNTAHHLLVNDAKLQEGETVATSRQDWVRVFLRPSMLDAKREIYCLKIDGEGRDGGDAGYDTGYDAATD